jgi:hypothetical protein
MSNLAKTSTKTPNYTAAQEAVIREAAAEGPLNLARATELAARLGKTPKSVTAKIGRMGLAYERKQPVSKNGEPVAKKDAVVEAIEAIVCVNLDGLEKAPKLTLQRLRSALVELAQEDVAEAA